MRGYQPTTTMNAFSTDAALHFPNDENQLFSQVMFFSPSQYPESIAYWHDISLSTPPIPVVDPTSTRSTSLINQAPVKQRKYKRTRSGCFTCRLRRVKCDEGRPTCDRCKKGNRDCKYPPPTNKQGGNRQNRKNQGARQNSACSLSSEDNEITQQAGLEAVPDENGEDEEEEEEGEEGAACSGSSPSEISKSSNPRPSDADGTQETKKDLAPTASNRSLQQTARRNSPKICRPAKSLETSSTANQSSPQPSRLSELSEDIQFYLSYHRQHLNYHHYFLRLESVEFVKTTLLDHALSYEPLLYAVVGFAAWHHTLGQADGKLNDFLQYYHRSLTLLRESLASKEKRGEGMLLTILQLATFEESIGDFVNLIEHQLAANALMSEVLSTSSILTVDLHRHIFIWYSWFDVTVGILGNSGGILSREWYVAREKHDEHQAILHPTDALLQLAWVRSQIRLFALDFASLHAKLNRNLISIDQFLDQYSCLEETRNRIHRIVKNVFDSVPTVEFRGSGQEVDPDDVFDPTAPTRVCSGPLWGANFIWADVLATGLMFQFQSIHILGNSDYAELKALSLQICRIVEATLRCSEVEEGCILSFKFTIAMASMFLPRDQKFIGWMLRKIVSMEQNGCTFPPRYRSAMAEIFQMPEINHWWLPNDEGCPNALREMRVMVDERINNARDNFQEGVRDLKYFFEKFSIDDSGSQSSPSTLAQEPSPEAACSWQQQQPRSMHGGDNEYSPQKEIKSENAGESPDSYNRLTTYF